MRKAKAVVFTMCACLAATGARATQSRINIGDTVEVSVVGMPDLLKRALVNEDGEISYPVLGGVKAAGLTANELRGSLIEQLVNNGMKDPKVGVEIVTRQPFYVTGDVLKPGAEPYVLNITVRSAVALAGGLDPAGAREAKSSVNPLDGSAHIETWALEYIKQHTHIRRLEAELANKPTFAMAAFPDLPVPSEVVEKVAQLEEQELKLRLEDMVHEKAYLKGQVAQIQEQIAQISERRKADQESIRLQAEELERVKSLADRGITTQTRLHDSRQTMLNLNVHSYQTIGDTAQATRLLDEANRKLQSIEEARKLVVMKELEDAQTALALATSRLDSMRLRLAGRNGSYAPAFHIYRQKDGSRLRLNVDENESVLPGDILEVEFIPPAKSARSTPEAHAE